MNDHVARLRSRSESRAISEGPGDRPALRLMRCECEWRGVNVNDRAHLDDCKPLGQRPPAPELVVPILALERLVVRPERGRRVDASTGDLSSSGTCHRRGEKV